MSNLKHYSDLMKRMEMLKLNLPPISDRPDNINKQLDSIVDEIMNTENIYNSHEFMSHKEIMDKLEKCYKKSNKALQQSHILRKQQ